MANYGMHSLSCSSSKPGHETSGQGFGGGHWYGAATSQPRCYEPSSCLSYGGHSAGGGYGSFGGPSGYGRFSCRNTSGSVSTCGGGFGGPGGSGGYTNWCSPRPYSSPQWGASWGN